MSNSQIQTTLPTWVLSESKYDNCGHTVGARYREQKEVARFKKPQLAVEEQTGKILLHNSKSFSWRSIFRCPSISCTGQQRNSMTDWSELGISRENDHPRFTGVGNFMHFNYIHASVFWNSADLPQSLQLHQLIVYDQERSFYIRVVTRKKWENVGILEKRGGGGVYPNPTSIFDWETPQQ